MHKSCCIPDTVWIVNYIKYYTSIFGKMCSISTQFYFIVVYMCTVSDTVFYSQFTLWKNCTWQVKKYTCLPHLAALCWKAVPTFNFKHDILKVLPDTEVLNILWNIEYKRYYPIHSLKEGNIVCDAVRSCITLKNTNLKFCNLFQTLLFNIYFKILLRMYQM